MALQNIISSSGRMGAGAAETHRISAISNIESALESHEFTDEQEVRLKRLLRILNDAANEIPERKLAVLQQNVIPALVGLGLVEE